MRPITREEIDRFKEHGTVCVVEVPPNLERGILVGIGFFLGALSAAAVIYTFTAIKMLSDWL